MPEGKKNKALGLVGVAAAGGILAWSLISSFTARTEQDALLQAFFSDTDTDGMHLIQSASSYPKLKGYESSEVNMERSLQASGSVMKKDLNLKARTSERYEIINGDTLWGISYKFGVSVEDLKVANGIDGDEIYAGEWISIPPR